MKIIERLNLKIGTWSKERFFQISVFNLIIIILFLLRSAGYFNPYFVINVNFIVITSLILSIPLLGANSRVIFSTSLFFWLFAGILLALNLGVWAERTAVYTFESLVVAMVLLIIETIKIKEI